MFIIAHYSRDFSQLNSNAALSGKSWGWAAGMVYHNHPSVLNHPHSPAHNLYHSAPTGQSPPLYSTSHCQLHHDTLNENRLKLTPKLAPLKINSNFISPLEIVKSRLYLAM